MAFGKGTVSVNSKPKELKNRVDRPLIIEDHFDASVEDYYVFLIEGYTDDKRILATLKSDIIKAGFKSFVIAPSCNTIYVNDDVKQKYEYMRTHQTNWRSLIDYNGKHANAIMAFGAALYSINKGTDLLASDFYDTKMNKPYYYIGHGFIGDFDTFIFPVDSIESIWPKEWAKGKKFRPDESNENWRTRFYREQLQNMQKEKVLPSDMRDYKIVVCTDEMKPKPGVRLIKHTAKDILTSLLNSKVLAWDTETSGLKWYRNKLHCFTFCNDGETGYYIPSKTILESPELRELLCQVMYTCNTMVGANIKFDLHFLMHEIPEFDLLKVKHVDDIQQMSHCINSDRTKGLKPGTFFYTPFGGYDDELDVFKRKTGVENYSYIPDDILSKYATIDAIVTYRIFFALIEHINYIDEHFPNEKAEFLPANEQWNCKMWYENQMAPAYVPFVRMEHRGMMMDNEKMLQVRKYLQEEIPKVAKQLSELWHVPEDFKFGSTTQLGKLIKEMGWPAVEISKAGNYATSDACIQEWKRQNRPGIAELVRYRELNSFLGTFIGVEAEEDDYGNIKEAATGWEKFITYHPEDNSYRIHQSYGIMGTETFRCIGRDPNLQNIPAHSKLSDEVKQCIIVPTAVHYKFTNDDGTLICEGGALDTVEVEGKGRISLANVGETDIIVPNSFNEYIPKYDKVFA